MKASQEKIERGVYVPLEYLEALSSLPRYERGNQPMTKNNGSTVTETITTKDITTKDVATKGVATKAEQQKLFAAYEAAEAKLTAAQAAVDAAKAVRSNAIAALCAAAGGTGFVHPKSKLPLKAVQRVNKETGESTWYFKGPGTQDLIEL